MTNIFKSGFEQEQFYILMSIWVRILGTEVLLLHKGHLDSHS